MHTVSLVHCALPGTVQIIEMNETVNTVQFRFPPGSPRPSWEEIAKFIKQLDTDPLLMECAYKTARDRSLFVKFKSQDAMMDSMKKNSEPRSVSFANGDSVVVRMCIAGSNMHYVRVFDLPPELSDDSLARVLESYGKVELVVREKFPPDLGLDHMYTGVRGVYIDVEKEIPPSVDVTNRKARIFYSGLKDTCFLCQEVGHRRDSCPQRATRSKQDKRQKDSSTPSYAAVVSAGKESIERPTENVVEEIIEILEEDVIAETDSIEDVQEESPVCETEEISDKEKRRKAGLEALEEVAKAIQEAMANPQAAQRRAQYAASRSSSGSGTAPRKKCARRTHY